MRSVRFRLSDREGKAWESLEEGIKGQRSPGRFQKRPGPLSQACAALPTPVLAPSLSQLGFLPPPTPTSAYQSGSEAPALQFFTEWATLPPATGPLHTLLPFSERLFLALFQADLFSY